LSIDENSNGVYVAAGTTEEYHPFKLDIAQQVKNELILSEAILKAGSKYASYFTLTHPLEMKLVNNHPGILVAAKTLKDKTNLF
jgi:hypothetical protein